MTILLKKEKKKVSMNNNQATLFLVATPIGNLSEVSNRTLETLKNVDVIACEDTRNTIKLLTHFDIHTRMISYHNFNEEKASKEIVSFLKEGKSVALVSDAGYPLISDPGFTLVNEVIENDIKIVPISGPNACLNALVSSGLPTSHFLFYGFLNAKQSLAKKELEELKDFPYTIVFYEAPHRINKTLNLCLEVFGNRRACLARELTKMHEEFIRGSLEELNKLEDLKGEMVLVVEGHKEEEVSINLDDLCKKVDELISKGLKTKEAITKISKEYKVSKNNLYDYYHANR